MHHQASIIQHSYTNALTNQDKLSSDHRCSHILFSINKPYLYFLMVLYFSYFLENILVKALNMPLWVLTNLVPRAGPAWDTSIISIHIILS